jgi:hypothetical protein
MNLKKIFDAVTDIIPLGGLAKSLVKGAGSLLFKKAAKAVGVKDGVVDSIFVEAERLAEYDHEIKKALIEEEKEKRAHELAVFGRFAELDVGSQKLRARIRPLLSFGLIGLFMVYGIVALIQQLFPTVRGLEFAIVFPPALVKRALAVVGFWFGGRTIEKVFGKDN